MLHTLHASMRGFLADDGGQANPKWVMLAALVTLPVAGGYAMGYDVGGEALFAFNNAIAGIMRMIGV